MAGKIEFARPQRIVLSSVVVSTDSVTCCSSAAPLEVSSQEVAGAKLADA